MCISQASEANGATETNCSVIGVVIQDHAGEPGCFKGRLNKICDKNFNLTKNYQQ